MLAGLFGGGGGGGGLQMDGIGIVMVIVVVVFVVVLIRVFGSLFIGDIVRMLSWLTSNTRVARGRVVWEWRAIVEFGRTFERA